MFVSRLSVAHNVPGWQLVQEMSWVKCSSYSLFNETKQEVSKSLSNNSGLSMNLIHNIKLN